MVYRRELSVCDARTLLRVQRWQAGQPSAVRRYKLQELRSRGYLSIDPNTLFPVLTARALEALIPWTKKN